MQLCSTCIYAASVYLKTHTQKKPLPFFCWKEWGMMGSVVGIRGQRRAVNLKAVHPAQESERGPLLQFQKSFQQRRSLRLVNFSICDPEPRNWNNNCYQSFIGLACSWMIQDVESDWCPSLQGEWQLKLQGWSHLQCKKKKGCPVSESQQQSSSGEASCLSLFSRMGMLLERRAWQRSESSRLSTLHVSENSPQGISGSLSW